MPQLDESVPEGTFGKWLKPPGHHVTNIEPLVEVVTDKVNAEVPSPFEGVLREILVEEGATVPNNAEIAVIETADEAGGASAGAGAPAPAASAATEKEAAPSEPDAGVEVEVRNPEAAAAGGAHGPAGSDERRADERPDRAAAAAGAGAPSATAPTAGSAAGGVPVMAAATSGSDSGSSAPTRNGEDPGNGNGNPDARMTPAVRRLLREHGLSAAQIVGTGGGGRITREDVTNFVESQRTRQPGGGQAVGAPAAAASADGSAAAPAAAPAPPGAPAAPAPPAPAP